MMKKGKRALALLLAATISVSSFSPTIATAAVKNGWNSAKTVYYVNGVKSKGLKKISGKYYFFNSKGKVLKAKWKVVKGKKYYFSKATGAAVTGVRKIGKKYYLFKKTGALTGTGLVTSGGKKYLVKKGVIQIGLAERNGYTYYGTKKGLKSGWVTAGGKEYYFNPKNYRMVKNKWVDGKYLGPNGYVTEVKEPVVEEPTTETPTTEDPVTETPTTEEPETPTTEKPVIEEYGWSTSSSKWTEKTAIKGKLVSTGSGKYALKQSDGSYYSGKDLYYYAEGETKASKHIRLSLGKSNYLAYRTGTTGAVSESGWYYLNSRSGWSFPLEGELVTENGIRRFRFNDGSYYCGEAGSSNTNLIYSSPVSEKSERTIEFDAKGYAISGELGSGVIFYNGEVADTFEEARLGLLTEKEFKEFQDVWLKSGMTDLEKFMAVAMYIDSLGLVYDISCGGKHRTAVGFLECGKGVCEHWCRLIYLLCIVAELESAPLDYPSKNHVNNLVKIDDSWYVVDFTGRGPDAYDGTTGGVLLSGGELSNNGNGGTFYTYGLPIVDTDSCKLGEETIRYSSLNHRIYMQKTKIVGIDGDEPIYQDYYTGEAYSYDESTGRLTLLLEWTADWGETFDNSNLINNNKGSGGVASLSDVEEPEYESEYETEEAESETEEFIEEESEEYLEEAESEFEEESESESEYEAEYEEEEYSEEDITEDDLESEDTAA